MSLIFIFLYLVFCLTGLCITIVLVFNKDKFERSKFYPVICLGLFLVIIICLHLFNYYKVKKYNFKGIISHISYNTKQIPSIVVDHETYHLSPKRDFDKIVSIGDSAIKIKDEMKVKFIKKNSKVVIYMEL